MTEKELRAYRRAEARVSQARARLSEAAAVRARIVADLATRERRRPLAEQLGLTQERVRQMILAADRRDEKGAP